MDFKMNKLLNLNTMFIYRIILIICSVLVNTSDQQNTPSNPCPNIFQYIYDGSEWYGIMQLPSPPLGQSVKVNVLLSLPALLPTSYVGVVELYYSREVTLQAIMRNGPIRYRIRFPLTYPIPKLTSIMYNNRELCRGSTEVESVVTEIRLEHVLYTKVSGGNNQIDSYPTYKQTDYSNLYGSQIPEQPTDPYMYKPATQRPDIILDTNNYGYRQNSYRQKYQPQYHYTPDYNYNYDSYNNFNDGTSVSQPQPQPQQQPQPQPQRQTLRPQRPTRPKPKPKPQPPPTQSTTPPPPPPPPPATLYNSQYDQTNEICGTSDDRFYNTPLIVGGQSIQRGAWPWLVAIYLNKARSLTFHCSGNLITNKLIVSAGHCYKNSKMTLDPSDVIAFLGRFNIMKYVEEKAEYAEIDSLFVHEDYMKYDHSYDADIAILVLQKRIEYSEYIRPICLWSGSADVTLVEGKEGVIVGWGRDGIRPVTAEPKKISIPIVSESDCLRSSGTFQYITKKRNFCAGRRDGTGPCNGDSGGGMAIQQNNRWALRGIVSASLSDPISNICNLSGYVVFTDAAKFTHWIKAFMNF